MFSLISRGFQRSRSYLRPNNFYTVLGITRKASAKTIKESYFDLAKKYHPDVNKDPNAKVKFAEINIAYETLGDPAKKRTYDNTGLTGDEQDQAKDSGFDPEGFGSDDFSIEDIFAEFEHIFRAAKSKKPKKKVEKTKLTIEIGFMEAINGITKQVFVGRKCVCDFCKGSKVKNGSKQVSCSSCGGRGLVIVKKGTTKIESVCRNCKGHGYVLRNHCGSCNGTGEAYIDKPENIEIPAGVADGQEIRVQSKGYGAEKGRLKGELFIKIRISPHSVFKREAQNVFSEVDLSVSQAALGSVVEVDTLYGKLKIQVEPGVNSGDSKQISGFGVQHLPPNQHLRGNHILTFNVKVPRELTNRQRRLYEELAYEDDEASINYANKIKV